MTSQINNNTSLDYLKLGIRGEMLETLQKRGDNYGQALIDFYELIRHLFPRPAKPAFKSSVNIKSYSATVCIVDDNDVTLAMLACPYDYDHVLLQVSGGMPELCEKIVMDPIFMDDGTWVMRIDVAYDILESDMPYEEMMGTIVEMADSGRMAKSHQSSYTQDGKLKRTQYAGARAGYAMVRWYEKSVQIASEGPKWNRLEFEIKPTKEKRNKAHRYDIKRDVMSYVETGDPTLLQYSQLGSDIATVVHGRELVALKRTVKHYGETPKAIAHMLVQYNKRIEDLLDTYGFSLDKLHTEASEMRLRGRTDRAVIEALCEMIQG